MPTARLAGRVGAARGHLDRLAAPRAGLAGKLEPIPWVYAEIVRVLHAHERVEILCHDGEVREEATRALRCARRRPRPLPAAPRAHRPRLAARLGADVVVTRRRRVEVDRAGASTPGRSTTTTAPTRSSRRRSRELAGLPRRRGAAARRAAAGSCSRAARSRPTAPGTLLITEEWLLSTCRSATPGSTATDYERVFREYLGIRAHDLARRGMRGRRHARPRRRHRALRGHRHGRRSRTRRTRRTRTTRARSTTAAARARGATRAAGCASSSCPFRAPVIMNGERLPASYANFYIANGVVHRADVQRPQRPRRAEHTRRVSSRTARSSASTPWISSGDWARCTA